MKVIIFEDRNYRASVPYFRIEIEALQEMYPENFIHIQEVNTSEYEKLCEGAELILLHASFQANLTPEEASSFRDIIDFYAYENKIPLVMFSGGYTKSMYNDRTMQVSDVDFYQNLKLFVKTAFEDDKIENHFKKLDKFATKI